MTTSKSNNLTTPEALPGFQLEWIQTGSMLGIQHGKAYFAFDVRHESRTDNMDVKMTCSVDTASFDSKLVGCSYESDGMSIMFTQINGRVRALVPCLWFEPMVQLTTVTQPVTISYHYEKDNGEEKALTQIIDRNGIPYGTSTDVSKGFVDSIKIWKFGIGGNYQTDRVVPATSGRIHEIVIDINNKPIHHLIPFESKEGQIGMFDLVDAKFYRSESGIEFYPGPRM